MIRLRRERILAAFLMLLAPLHAVTAAKGDGKESREAGRKALAAGDLDAAEDHMKEAIVAAKALGPDHLRELVDAFVGLSDVYLNEARMTEANVLLEHALLLLAQTPGVDSRELDPVYNNLATVRISQKNLPEAESLLNRVLTNREMRLGREHPDLAEVLERLADLAFDQNHKPNARALHKRALAIREHAPGASSADVIKALAQGVHWYELHEDRQEAEALWRRLLPIQEKTLGAAHRDVASTLMQIVECHLNLGLLGDSSMSHDNATRSLFPSATRSVNLKDELLANFRTYEPILARVLAIREKSLGPDDVETLQVVQYLAAGYERQADWVRAVPLFQRILAAREKTLGPEHPDLARPLAILAGCSMIQHQFRAAIPLLTRLAAIQAAEKPKAPKDPVQKARFRPPGIDEVDEDDPNDAAALLRKAIRLAFLEETPAAWPTDQDLAFLRSEGWCSAVSDLPALLDLTSIVLHNKRVDNAALLHIRGLVNLRRLVVNPALSKFTRPNIDDAGLAQLHNLTALKSLDLQGTALRGPGLSALGRMSELEQLNISWTFLDDAGLTALPTLPDLQHLDLSNTTVSDRSVPVLKKLTGLKGLHIYGTRISEQGAAELRRTIPGVRVFGPKLELP